MKGLRFGEAGRHWHNPVTKLGTDTQLLRVALLIALAILLLETAFVLWIAASPRFFPVPIIVDKLNHVVTANAVGELGFNKKERFLKAAITNFIKSARTISVDSAELREDVLLVQAMLEESSQASEYYQTYFLSSPRGTPLERAKKELVTVQVLTVLKVEDSGSGSSWEVIWEEEVTSRGGKTIDAYQMRAILGVELPDLIYEDEHLERNPLGVFVSTLQWGRASS